jgi:hypothetical protein
MTFQSLPGFRDFFPAEFTARHHIMTAWRETARRYGFEEYDGPPLEPLELYVEKSGDEIVGQLYNFVDKGGREVALRPEMTPTLARMVGERGRSLPKPIRWFSMPQLFRYERTQRGRLREHFQWNVDVIGEADVSAGCRSSGGGAGGAGRPGARARGRGGEGQRPSPAGAVLVADRAWSGPGWVRPTPPSTRWGGRRRPGRGTASVPARDSTAAGRSGCWSCSRATWTSLAAVFGDDSEIAPEIERLREYFGLLGDLGWADHVRFDPTSSGGWPTTRARSSRSSTGRASCGRSAVAAGTTTCWRP